MKYLILLLLFASFQMNAQFDRHFNLIIGNGWSGRYEPDKGTNGSDIKFNRVFRSSFMTGIGFNFDFIRRSSFETNLVFQQSGTMNQIEINNVVVNSTRLSAFSVQLALAYKYAWIKKKHFTLMSKTGFITAFPILFALEEKSGSFQNNHEFPASSLIDRVVYFPYYFGISTKFRDFELGLTYAFCPSSDINKSFGRFSFIDSQSFLTNLQLELSYRIY